MKKMVKLTNIFSKTTKSLKYAKIYAINVRHVFFSIVGESISSLLSNKSNRS